MGFWKTKYCWRFDQANPCNVQELESDFWSQDFFQTMCYPSQSKLSLRNKSKELTIHDNMRKTVLMNALQEFIIISKMVTGFVYFKKRTIFWCRNFWFEWLRWEIPGSWESTDIGKYRQCWYWIQSECNQHRDSTKNLNFHGWSINHRKRESLKRFRNLILQRRHIPSLLISE